MSNTLVIKYKKPNATFSSAQEAFSDKTQLYTPELTQHILSVRQQLLDSGVLLEPETYTWSQDTFELVITRKLSSFDEYKAITEDPITGWSTKGLTFSEQAGWTKSAFVVYDAQGNLVGGTIAE